MNKILRIFLLFAVLVAGVWLLGRPSGLQPEGTARLQALNSLSANSAAVDGAQDGAQAERSVVHDAVTPAVVNFAEVTISTETDDGMIDRWLRGELDLDENDSIVGEAEFAQMVQAALAQPASDAVQIAQSVGEGDGPQPAAPVPGVSFDAIDYTDSGGSVPPDPELAVGPDHMIAVVNVAMAIYDKTGTTLFGPTVAENLFSQPSCQSGLYDPNVLYDEESDRWILAYDKGAFESTGGYCLLASQSGNPLGTWNEYFFNLNDASVWLDYPHAGVGDNYIFMGANMFTMGGAFSEGRIFAFDKSDLYAGAAVSAIERGLGSAGSTPQPLRLHGQSSGTWPNLGNNHYFFSDPYDGQNYALQQWNPATDDLTLVDDVDLGVGNQPVNVSQNGAGLIQANDYRPLDFEYRNGYGWTTQTVSCNPGGGVVNCIRWAQINLTDGSYGPAGTGTYGSDGQHRFFPDLAVNHCDDMAVGYTRSGSSSFPSIWVTGRESTDPNGVLQAEVEMKAGEIAYTAFDGSPRRWGDYTGMTIDPDGETFWYLGQYSKDTGTTNGRWATYIGSFSYGDCTAPIAEPEIVVDPGAFAVSQNADSVVSRTMTISNTGTAALMWTIEEAEGQAPEAGNVTSGVAGTEQVGQAAQGDSLSSFLASGEPLPAAAPYTPVELAPRTPTSSHLIIYGDRSAFDADNPGLPMEDFEEGNVAASSFAECTGPIDENTNNSCFGPGDILPGVQFADAPGPGVDDMVLLGTGVSGNPSKSLISDTFLDSFVITFTTTVNAVGMDLQSHFAGSTVDITVYEADNTTVMTTTTASATNAGSFWGLNSSDPIGRIVLTSQSEQAEGVDNISFGESQLTGCSAPQDVPWLSLSETAGSTPAGDSSEVDVTFDATGMATGVYTATLCIDSNDALTPLVQVPIEMTVTDDWQVYLPAIMKP